MPIQFVCPQCHQTLSIAQRKVGSVIHCPRCHAATIVPDTETAAAQMSAVRGVPSGGVIELVVYDDVPAMLAQPGAPPAWGAGPMTAPAMPTTLPQYSVPQYSIPQYPAPTPMAVPTTYSAQPVVVPATHIAATPIPSTLPPGGGGWLLISRHGLYAQLALLLIFGGVAFAVGYGIGRSHVSDAVSTASTTTEETVSLRGRLTYDVGQGAFPDTDAVVVALPKDRTPDKRLKGQGLRADEESKAARDLALEEIQDAGGDMVRANTDGEFHLIVRRPGDYQLLVVSRKSLRPVGTAIAKADLDQLATWFESPAAIIGRQQYVWKSETLAGNPPLFRYSFHGAAE